MRCPNYFGTHDRQCKLDEYHTGGHDFETPKKGPIERIVVYAADEVGQRRTTSLDPDSEAGKGLRAGLRRRGLSVVYETVFIEVDDAGFEIKVLVAREPIEECEGTSENG